MNNPNYALYQISKEEDALIEKMSSLEGADELDEQNFELLVTRNAEVIANALLRYKDNVEVIDKHIKRLQDLKTSTQNADKSLRKNILKVMLKLGITKLKGLTMTISTRKPLKKLEIHPDASIPFDCIETKTITKIDNAKLKKKIENNEIINGVSLVEGEPSLMIRTKGVN